MVLRISVKTDLARSRSFQCLSLYTRVTKSSVRSMASSSDTKKHLNRLSKEKSPYLLQHSTNPVDWYPWCNEAFEKAKAESKVIFLSVGYSTCHWCHVMERESFESERVAKIMNQHFVNIKVDREERPDIDRVYMTYVQASTGSGGWPMSVWLTPDLKPIIGGTYFPPDERYFGRPGFCTILLNVAQQWEKNRAKVEEQGHRILSLLQESVVLSKSSLPSTACVQTCYEQISRGYDERMGGFSQAPKFPQPVNFNFLLRYYTLNKESEKGKKALEMVLHTLKMMARGGIHDHVSKGFHRYSTDGQWHVPHFEKMLYDQAQLTVSCLDAFQITGDSLYSDVAKDILDYVERDLRHESGGCYSAEDADSLPTPDSKEKREGAFCVWTWAEVQELLTEPVAEQSSVTLANVFSRHFNVKKDGNVNPYQDPHDELKGRNVLIETCSLEETANHFELSLDVLRDALQRAKDRLHEVRLLRPRPHLDDKMIAAWNGLALSAFARAAQVLKEQRYLDSTTKLAEFLYNHMYDKDKKQLLRCVYRGPNNQVECTENPISAVLDDYCCVIKGLLDAYEVTFDLRWLEWAHDLQETQQELFWDGGGSGGYFNAHQEDQNVVLHIKADQDGAEPSGNSVAVSNLVRLGHMYARHDFHEHAEKLVSVFGEHLSRSPLALPEMVVGFMYLTTPYKQIIIRGEEDNADLRGLVECVQRHFNPFKSVILANSKVEESSLATKLDVLSEILKQKEGASAHVCEKNTCLPPVSTPEELSKLLYGQ